MLLKVSTIITALITNNHPVGLCM